MHYEGMVRHMKTGKDIRVLVLDNCVMLARDKLNRDATRRLKLFKAVVPLADMAFSDLTDQNAASLTSSVGAEQAVATMLQHHAHVS